MMKKFKYWATCCAFLIVTVPVLIIHAFITLPIYYAVELIVRIEKIIGESAHGVIHKMSVIMMRLKREAYDED